MNVNATQLTDYPFSIDRDRVERVRVEGRKVRVRGMRDGEIKWEERDK